MKVSSLSVHNSVARSPHAYSNSSIARSRSHSASFISGLCTERLFLPPRRAAPSSSPLALPLPPARPLSTAPPRRPVAFAEAPSGDRPGACSSLTKLRGVAVSGKSRPQVRALQRFRRVRLHFSDRVQPPEEHTRIDAKCRATDRGLIPVPRATTRCDPPDAGASPARSTPPPSCPGARSGRSSPACTARSSPRQPALDPDVDAELLQIRRQRRRRGQHARMSPVLNPPRRSGIEPPPRPEGGRASLLESLEPFALRRSRHSPRGVERSACGTMEERRSRCLPLGPVSE